MIKLDINQPDIEHMVRTTAQSMKVKPETIIMGVLADHFNMPRLLHSITGTMTQKSVQAA